MENTCCDPLLEVDSYSNIFMYSTDRHAACVPRHIVRMTEPVQPILLQQAVEKTLVRFPQMALGFAKTETQYVYRRLTKKPCVLPLDGFRQRYKIGTSDTNGYLFLTGYHKNTILFEYQHTMCDGHGFDIFIRSILYRYLCLIGHDIDNDGSIIAGDTAFSWEEKEDAYLRLRSFPASAERDFKKDGAFHIPHEDGQDYEILTEITFPFQQLRSVAKELGASPLTVIAPIFARSIFDVYGSDGFPQVAQIPVDLRQILPSKTLRFFICFLDLPYLDAWQRLPLTECFKQQKALLEKEMAPERLTDRALKACDTCSKLHMRTDLSLVEKNEEGRRISRDFVLGDSYLITNIGSFQLPPSMEPYIADYGAILPSAAQPVAMLISSYKGIMKLNIAQRLPKLDICRNMIKHFAQIGVKAQMMSFPFRATEYNGEYLD